MKERYHYTDSGLNNVWLLNGFEVIDTAYGPAVAIQDLDGLHRALARMLVNDKAPLGPKEIRFLRKELGLSQNGVAKMIGLSDQTIARWEKNTPIDPSADRLIRLIVRDWLEDDIDVREALQELAETDERTHGDRLLHHDRRGWVGELAAAA